MRIKKTPQQAISASGMMTKRCQTVQNKNKKGNKQTFYSFSIRYNRSFINFCSTNWTKIQFERTFLTEARVLTRFQQDICLGIDT